MDLKDIEQLRAEIDAAVHSDGPLGKTTAAGLNALLKSLAAELIAQQQQVAGEVAQKADLDETGKVPAAQLPTPEAALGQNVRDALQGTQGNPSNANRFVTDEALASGLESKVETISVGAGTPIAADASKDINLAAVPVARLVYFEGFAPADIPKLENPLNWNAGNFGEYIGASRVSTGSGDIVGSIVTNHRAMHLLFPTATTEGYRYETDGQQVLRTKAL